MFKQRLVLLLVTALVAGAPTPPASSSVRTAPDVVRTVTRQYGDGPVRNAAKTDVVRIKFLGRSGDKVSLHRVAGRISSPVDALDRGCSSVRLRSVHDTHGSGPDDQHALTLRRGGWHVLTYRACGRESKRPPALQLMKWNVRELVLDGAARDHVRRRGFLTVFEVAVEAGDRLHLQSDTPARSDGVGFPDTVPFFTSDLGPGHRAPATGTYTFVENTWESTYFDPVARTRIRARRILELPPADIATTRTFVVTDPGQWQVSSIELPADTLFRLRYENSTFPAKDAWQAVLQLDPPMRCGSRAPNGCGDFTVTHVPGSSSGVAYEGTYRLFLTTHPGVTGSVDLVVEPCPTTGC